MPQQLKRLTTLANEAFLEFPPIRQHLLSRLDKAFQAGPVEGFACLRSMAPATVGQLLLDIPARYPHAASALPRMPSIEVQQNWTGNHGVHLLRQSIVFAESIANGYRRHGSTPLETTNVLDYGCGWGRLMRLMYAYVAPEHLYGCDPWDQSLDICRDTGIKGHLAQCEYIPKQLPFATSFNLIYAFSVFTHLSQRTADAVMATFRRGIGRDGILAITIRPESYWDQYKGDDATVQRMKRLHTEQGYAFVPHDKALPDGEVTYGDTSMTLQYIEQRWTDWRIVETLINARDPLQRLVFLKPDV